jgi:hypothetical protein
MPCTLDLAPLLQLVDQASCSYFQFPPIFIRPAVQTETYFKFPKSRNLYDKAQVKVPSNLVYLKCYQAIVPFCRLKESFVDYFDP